MTPGPKPKAPEIAEKQGNPGHRPIVKPVDSPQVDASAPDWLDEMGITIWSAYMPRMRSMGYVKDTDRLAFARLCDHTSRWLKLRLKVNERGESYTTESRHGKMERINPDFAAMLRVEEKMVQLEDRFGLTPASRQQILARLTEPPPPPDMFANGEHAQRAPDQSQGSPIGIFAPIPAQGRPN